jgi:hypothetical protein
MEKSVQSRPLKAKLDAHEMRFGSDATNIALVNELQIQDLLKDGAEDAGGAI